MIDVKKLNMVVSCVLLFGGHVFAQQTDSVLFGEIGKQVAFSAGLKTGDNRIEAVAGKSGKEIRDHVEWMLNLKN